MRIEGKSFDEERALYGFADIEIVNCKIAGDADGESALKECGAVKAKDCFFDLRYPLWHDGSVELENCEMTERCRAALWYTQNVTAKNVKMHGIKAVRECKNVRLYDCDINSPEFGWSTDGLELYDTCAESVYFAMRASNIKARGLKFKGKYSFQYVENAVFDGCDFDTKDAFWHAENVTVKNSIVKGEYLAWYSKNVTFENCTIIGTQPLCYCDGLKLTDCKMINTDLAFERSIVDATLISPIVSIKNPYGGKIIVSSVGEVIRDDPKAKGRIILPIA